MASGLPTGANEPVGRRSSEIYPKEPRKRTLDRFCCRSRRSRVQIVAFRIIGLNSVDQTVLRIISPPRFRYEWIRSSDVRYPNCYKYLNSNCRCGIHGGLGPRTYGHERRTLSRRFCPRALTRRSSASRSPHIGLPGDRADALPASVGASGRAVWPVTGGSERGDDLDALRPVVGHGLETIVDVVECDLSRDELLGVEFPVFHQPENLVVPVWLEPLRG